MGVPIKYHNGTDWVLIDAGAIVDTLGNRITADNITSHTTNSGIHITPTERTNWNGKINVSEKGIVNGVAPLDANGVIPDGYIKKGVTNGLATLGADGQLVQKPYITGTYTGDGVATKSINIGFRPTVIILFSKSGNTGSGYTASGMALDGYPSISETGYSAIAITSTGFDVAYNNNNVNTNRVDSVYNPFRYIAFR